MACKFCSDTGLRPDGMDWVVCGRCDTGKRLYAVLTNIARREPVAVNSVDDRMFFTAPCAYLDPMIETAEYVGGDTFGPKRED